LLTQFALETYVTKVDEEARRGAKQLLEEGMGLKKVLDLCMEQAAASAAADDEDMLWGAQGHRSKRRKRVYTSLLRHMWPESYTAAHEMAAVAVAAAAVEDCSMV
jgi:hypothetical protein